MNKTLETRADGKSRIILKVRRKVYVCTKCGFVYCDAPVTQCDCMPDKQEFYTGFCEYEQPEPKKRIVRTCRKK